MAKKTYKKHIKILNSRMFGDKGVQSRVLGPGILEMVGEGERIEHSDVHTFHSGAESNILNIYPKHLI